MESEQNRADEARPRSGHGLRAVAALRRVRLTASLVMLVTVGLVGAYVLVRQLATEGNACEATDDLDPLHRPVPFVGWDTPDRTLIVSGQLHGYMFPCGCSWPQQGGLVRRLTLINQLKAKGWDVVGVDLGELPPNLGEGIPRQRELKLEYTMKALEILGYKAVGLGRTEMDMPLMDALSQYSIDKPSPRPLNATLEITKQQNKVYEAMNVRPYEILPGKPKIGVASLIGPDLEDSLKKNNKNLEFRNNRDVVLPELYKKFADEKVEMAVVLHHEYPSKEHAVGNLQIDARRKQLAVALAQEWETQRQRAAKNKRAAIPPLQLVMVLTEEPEPPAVLQAVAGTPTHILEIGHKGKYVGVVGLYHKKNGSVAVKYELVKMEPHFDPAPGEKNAVRDVLDEYAKRLQAENLLRQFDFLRTAHPLQVDAYVKKTYGGSTFVGTARCLKCHKDEGIIWKASHHARAFQTLVKATEPAPLRQFDPECVVCHTVGFKHHEGYNDLPRAELEAFLKRPGGMAEIPKAVALRNPAFEHVGCENCHGPGSAHVQNPSDAKLHPLMNPFRATDAERQWTRQMDNAPNAAAKATAEQKAKVLFDRRMSRLDDFCQKCHDLENDVNWGKVPFLEKWRAIVHNDEQNVGNRWLPKGAPAVGKN